MHMLQTKGSSRGLIDRRRQVYPQELTVFFKALFTSNLPILSEILKHHSNFGQVVTRLGGLNANDSHYM